MAAVGRTGTVAFRVAYDAYGEARHLSAKDINGDGKVDSADTAIAQNAVKKRIGEPGYNPDADWDRDGTVSTRHVAAGEGERVMPHGRRSASPRPCIQQHA